MAMIRKSPGGQVEFGWLPMSLHAALGLAGSALGLVAAGFTLDRVPHWELPVFVFAMVYYVVGRALPDLVTEPHKMQRAFYFGLLPAVGSLTLYAAFQAWGHMWLAVLLGFAVGCTAQALLGRTVVPAVSAEEQAADAKEWLHTETWGDAGPHDLTPPPWAETGRRAN